MYIHANHYYEMNYDDGPVVTYVAEQRLTNGWVFCQVDPKDNWIRQGGTGTYFHEDDIDSLAEEGKWKEVFRERSKDLTDRAWFNFAMKIATCGDIDHQLSGADTSEVWNAEGEYQLFTHLWELPIAGEKEWLNRLECNPYATICISEDLWFEMEEQVGKAILKMRMIKKYLSEIPNVTTSKREEEMAQLLQDMIDCNIFDRNKHGPGPNIIQLKIKAKKLLGNQ